ncbi:hypothetical protein BGZ60DRAFT_570263 [Tricladium varicosporioides]|nr:hypothetical protein BGZ60DRAFT_570263 [Hymenoscyphus varicosporioides]
MAILPSLPGVTVTINTIPTNSALITPLTEYPFPNELLTFTTASITKHQHAVTRTCYIPSTTGQAFAVNLCVEGPYKLDCDGLAFRVFVDGMWIREPLLTMDQFLSGSWEDYVEGPVVDLPHGGFKVRTMHFTEIERTDEKLPTLEIKGHKEKIERVGEIVVEVHRITIITRVEERENTPNYELDYSQKFHEKSLVEEAKSHGTVLSKEVEEDRDVKYSVLDTEPIDGEDFPRAVFVFKYRSEKALQTLRILPSDPRGTETTAPTLVELPDPELKSRIEALSPVGKRQLVEFLGFKKIKQEYMGENDIGCAEPKRKKARKIIGKVIADLTEDNLESLQLQVIPCPLSLGTFPILRFPSPCLRSSFDSLSLASADDALFPFTTMELHQLEHLMTHYMRGTSVAASVSGGSMRGGEGWNGDGGGSSSVGERSVKEDDLEEERVRKRVRINAAVETVDLGMRVENLKRLL